MLNVTLLLAALIGAAFAAQPAINAVAAHTFQSAIPAAVLSIGITLVASSALMVLTGTTPSLTMIGNLPWWVVLGGLIGVLVVAGGAAIVPVTGVALFFVCLVFGQLLGSIIIDHFGAFGVPVREFSVMRALGLACAAIGVALVRFS